jgi:hypothetical protein
MSKSMIFIYATTPCARSVFPAMKIRVQSTSTQPLELVLSPDSNVKHVKEMMLSHDFPREVHLIHAGRVLADTMALSELLIEAPASCVWALLPSHALASVDFDLKDVHRIVPLGKFQVKATRRDASSSLMLETPNKMTPCAGTKRSPKSRKHGHETRAHLCRLALVKGSGLDMATIGARAAGVGLERKSPRDARACLQ